VAIFISEKVIRKQEIGKRKKRNRKVSLVIGKVAFELIPND
jgi:hypothetical protein